MAYQVRLRPAQAVRVCPAPACPVAKDLMLSVRMLIVRTATASITIDRAQTGSEASGLILDPAAIAQGRVHQGLVYQAQDCRALQPPVLTAAMILVVVIVREPGGQVGRLGRTFPAIAEIVDKVLLPVAATPSKKMSMQCVSWRAARPNDVVAVELVRARCHNDQNPERPAKGSVPKIAHRALRQALIDLVLEAARTLLDLGPATIPTAAIVKSIPGGN